MKSKLERYRVIAGRDNVLEQGKSLYLGIKNNWHKLCFKNNNPITLELGCGRGEYTIGLSALFPNINFIGVDLKGDRLWKGSTLAVEKKLTNVAFLRASALDITNFFSEGEVNDIWLPFPDPHLKRRNIKRRLTHPSFLCSYKKILTPKGVVRLKTDNTALFNYTLETLKERTDIKDLQSTSNLYQSPLHSECYGIETRYEKIFHAKGETIKYLRFHFKNKQC